MTRFHAVLVLGALLAAPVAAHAQTDSVFAVSRSGASLLRVNQDGRVGIGDSSPDQRLTVNGGVRADSALLSLVRFADGSSLTSMLITPTPANYALSWADFGSGYTGVRSYRDPAGIVHLEGVAIYSGGQAPSLTVFGLPAGQRPAEGQIALGYATGAPVMVTIGTNGLVRVSRLDGSNVTTGVLLSFTGISFLAGP